MTDETLKCHWTENCYTMLQCPGDRLILTLMMALVLHLGMDFKFCVIYLISVMHLLSYCCVSLYIKQIVSLTLSFLCLYVNIIFVQ